MPFSWYHPDVPAAYTDAGPKAARMYLDELEERAALLMRLGYSSEEATARLRGNIRWDFELHAPPAHLGLVEEAVKKVFKARRFGAGGPPSLEG